MTKYVIEAKNEHCEYKCKIGADGSIEMADHPTTASIGMWNGLLRYAELLTTFMAQNDLASFEIKKT